MTAQIDDTFRYRGVEYAIAGISAGELFDVTSLNLKPAGTSTACWRGYKAVFAVLDSQLALVDLHLNLFNKESYTREQGPVINGVTPTPAKGNHDWFNNHYRALNYPVAYTGGLLLGNKFIQKLYVHMGFHPAWKYQKVMELIFEAGELKAEFDRSERMAEVRDKLRASSRREDTDEMPTKEDIARFVERAFDRSYNM